MRGSKGAMVRLQNGGVVQKMVGPSEGRGKGAERSEKRKTITIEMTGFEEAMVRSQRGGMAEKREG